MQPRQTLSLPEVAGIKGRFKSLFPKLLPVDFNILITLQSQYSWRLTNMHLTTTNLATLGLLAIGATADFNVYCGLEIEGGAPTGDAYYCHFYGTDADPPRYI